MKPKFSSLISLILILSVPPLSAQLVVDSGPDTILCELSIIGYTLGGDPTVTGGIPPYSYIWSCIYEKGHITQFASSFIDDTTLANPSVYSGFDTLIFQLEVIDDVGNRATDSVTLIASIFATCAAECREYIHEGDSVKIAQCTFGGLPPLTFSWNPQESLSTPDSGSTWATPNTTTVYEVTITDIAGCFTKYHCTVIVFPTSIDSRLNLDHGSRIVPNPVSAQDYIFAIKTSSHQDQVLVIYDSKGVIRKKINLSEKQIEVEIGDFNSGMYIYTFDENGITIKSGILIVE